MSSDARGSLPKSLLGHAGQLVLINLVSGDRQLVLHQLYSKRALGLHQHHLRKLYQGTCRLGFPSEGMPFERKVAIGGIETVRVEGMTSVVVRKVDNIRIGSRVM